MVCFLRRRHQASHFCNSGLGGLSARTAGLSQRWLDFSLWKGCDHRNYLSVNRLLCHSKQAGTEYYLFQASGKNQEDQNKYLT